MSDKRRESGPTIPGPYLAPTQTETSPLKQTFLGSTRKSIESWVFGWDFSLDGSGSLKAIVVILFSFTGIITLALMTQLYYGDYQTLRHGAVATDNSECSQIGIDVLKNGGNAVDAAVAATMCLGVVNFHVTGLGGGGIFLGYNHKQQEAFDVINFLPSAPANLASGPRFDSAGQTVGVPGFLAGLWESHKRNGRQPWAELIMPSVLLARNGFMVSDALAAAAACANPYLESSELKNLLSNLTPGQNISIPPLAATLELIAEKGASVFYNGSLADQLIYSVKVGNGTMSLEDLSAYKTQYSASLKRVFGGYDIVLPADSIGSDLLSRTLENIQNLEREPAESLTADSIRKLSDVLYESYKLTFPNPVNLPEPAASVVVVIDDEDNYVSIVTGLSTWLGAQLLTDSGFLLNNAFLSNGAFKDNTPISLMTPVIVVQSNNVCGLRAASGAADARSLAQVLTELLLYGEGTNNSIEAPRFGLGPVPRAITLEDLHEPRLNNITLDALKSMKISIEGTQACAQNNAVFPYGSINIISKTMDVLWPYSDSRGHGEALEF